MASEFNQIRCVTCGKVVGELKEGQGRYKCRNCKTSTIVSIQKELAPQNSVPYQDRMGMQKK